MTDQEEPLGNKKHPESIVYICNLSEDVWSFISAISDPVARRNEIEENARIFKKTGVVIEINTSGLRKPANEIYPSQEHLKAYCQKGIPITFGSDAHRADDVGRDFDKGREWALAAGYKEYVMFEKRKIAKVVLL